MHFSHFRNVTGSSRMLLVLESCVILIFLLEHSLFSQRDSSRRSGKWRHRTNQLYVNVPSRQTARHCRADERVYMKFEVITAVRIHCSLRGNTPWGNCCEDREGDGRTSRRM
jgi:hypothetical protein